MWAGPTLKNKNFLIPDPSESASILHRTSPISNGSGISSSCTSVWIDQREHLKGIPLDSSFDLVSVGLVYAYIRQETEANAPYRIPAAAHERVTQTFCGT